MNASYRILALGLLAALVILPACEKTDAPAAGAKPAAPAAGNAFINLPPEYNTPDGMTLGKDGNIYLCMPNFNDPTFPAKLLKIDASDQITEVCTLPVHPETQRVCPLGIDQGPDGNFYIADCQAFIDKENMGRLLRVVMVQGKASNVEVLVTGMNFPNGLACKGDSVYVAETKIDGKKQPLPSGVYRFKMSELDAKKPVAITAGGSDKHLICTFTTQNKDWAVGANGLGFDAAGSMFVCNFGDAQLLKFPMKDGIPSGPAVVFAEKQGMKSTDGLKVDANGDIYIADFLGNAVHKVDGKSGKVTTLSQNGNTDGTNGLLDKCSEVCLRGNKIYVANIDLNLDGNKFDKPHTITILEKK